LDVKEHLKNVFKCLYVIERDTSDIYLRISKSLEDPLLSLTSKWISNESSNHAELVRTILRIYFNFDVTSEDLSQCYYGLGRLGEVIKQIYDRLSSKEGLTLRDVHEVLSLLDFIELNTGEEVYTKLIMPLVRDLMLGHLRFEDDVGVRILTEIFNSIIKEEESHEKLVMLMKSYIKLA